MSHIRQLQVWKCPRCGKTREAYGVRKGTPRKCLYCGKGKMARKS